MTFATSSGSGPRSSSGRHICSYCGDTVSARFPASVTPLGFYCHFSYRTGFRRRFLERDMNAMSCITLGILCALGPLWSPAYRLAIFRTLAATIPTNLDELLRPIPLFESPQVHVPLSSYARAPLKVYTCRAPPSASLPNSSFVSGTSPSPLVPTSVSPRYPSRTHHPLDRFGFSGSINHPIAKYMSYQGLSVSFQSFIGHVAYVSIPRSVFEALQNPQWVAVMQEKIDAWELNGTWELVPLPPGAKPVGSLWVFNVKFQVDDLLRGTRIIPVHGMATGTIGERGGPIRPFERNSDGADVRSGWQVCGRWRWEVGGCMRISMATTTSIVYAVYGEHPSCEASSQAKVGYNSIVWSHRLGNKGIELPPYASPRTKVRFTSIVYNPRLGDKGIDLPPPISCCF
ncbi:hypothetical protein Acr_00g0089180 [Actinidia rufa]|uniref:Mitochondrial protein n=1 Tax=Actinidia rufa TaxID=165716 RepID=A0A7J0DWK1_9ERIC|nr:hypothetical protein Acr_00g0089180 [Actinidia rufa]